MLEALGGHILIDVAWYDDDSFDTTHEVATKQANELGLYDMNGNGCRLTYRNDDDPGFVYNALGFRLAL